MQRQKPVDQLPGLPAQSDVSMTKAWINAALRGGNGVPAPVGEQVKQCLLVAKSFQQRHVTYHEQGS